MRRGSKSSAQAGIENGRPNDGDYEMDDNKRGEL